MQWVEYYHTICLSNVTWTSHAVTCLAKETQKNVPQGHLYNRLEMSHMHGSLFSCHTPYVAMHAHLQRPLRPTSWVTLPRITFSPTESSASLRSKCLRVWYTFLHDRKRQQHIIHSRKTIHILYCWPVQAHRPYYIMQRPWAWSLAAL